MKINAVCMSLSPFVSFQSRFVTYLLTYPRRNISCFYDLLRGLLHYWCPMASVEGMSVGIIGRYENLKKKYLLTFLRDFVSKENKHNYLLAVCDVISFAEVALCPAIGI